MDKRNQDFNKKNCYNKKNDKNLGFNKNPDFNKKNSFNKKNDKNPDCNKSPDFNKKNWAPLEGNIVF